MTIEFEDYHTRKIMKKAKDVRVSNGWRSLHTDFINNKESDGFHVTFVNGIDDPSNSPEAIQQRAEAALLELLLDKLKNDTITPSQLRVLMRLERGIPLLQSTMDKLTIALQGGLSGLIQRIKNLFNL